MYLYHQIEEMMAKYHDARYSVGEFVLKQMEHLSDYTIAEIAEKTYTSKSTVVRFAKTVGYETWKEFMRDFMREVHYQKAHEGDVDANYPFTENDPIEVIAEKIKQLQIESIKDTAHLIDIKILEKAKQYLLGAARIAIFGISPNIFLGELFRRKMVTIGKNIQVVPLGEGGIVSRSMGEWDCAIVISYSGNNIETEPMSHIRTLLERHVKIIGITGAENNYLRRNLDCVLTISTRERLYSKVANFATEDSILYLLNVLFACYFAENYAENRRYKYNNSKILESKRLAAIHEMSEINIL